MKENKLTWEEKLATTKIAKSTTKFTKIYDITARYIINQTNMQTFALYCLLLSHRNYKTKECFPSYAVLAKEADVSVPTVSRMIKNLKIKGIIRVGKKENNNTYLFPLETDEGRKKLKDLTIDEYED